MKSQQSSRKQNGHRRKNQDITNDRLINHIGNCHGKIVIATTLDGNKYQGLLISSSLTPNLSVVLYKPQCFTKEGELPKNLIIKGKDLVEIEIDMDQEPIKETFKTDSDISGKAEIKERELTKWEPEEPLDQILSLENEDDGATWDQFATNEAKFGIVSNFDEHLYTTRINKDAPDYQQRVERANRIAKDIESQQTTDRHMMEERGIVDDSGMDEEDKYSGVDRRGNELLAALKNTSIVTKQDDDDDKNDYKINDPAIVSSKNYRLNSQSEINSFKQFSANFKIPHKVPADLLPILSKNVDKQKEIIDKNTSDSETKSTPETVKAKKNKYNVKAASFTPTFTPAAISTPPNSRNGKRHYITAQEFFGNKLPTKQKQKDKLSRFRSGFNLSQIQEKAFQTPPTWDSTIEETYSRLFPRVSAMSSFSPVPQFKYLNQQQSQQQQQQQQQPHLHHQQHHQHHQQAAMAAAQMQAAQVQAMMYQQQFQPQPYYQQPQFSFIPPPMMPYQFQQQPQQPQHQHQHQHHPRRYNKYTSRGDAQG